MVTRSTREALLTLLGTSTLVSGAYLRWTYPNEIIAATPTMVVDNMHTGFEFGRVSYDVFVIISAVTALVALGFTTRTTLRAGATMLSGLVPGILCLQFLRGDLVSFTGAWVPGDGWYLTVFGGAILLLNGGLLAYETTESRFRSGEATH